MFVFRPYFEADDTYSYEFDGTMTLPAGDHKMEVWVYNPSGLPCVKIDSDSLVSDEEFKVGNNNNFLVKAKVCECGDLTPNTFAYPTRPMAWQRSWQEDGATFYDFGKIVSVFASLESKTDASYRLYFGETLRESKSDKDCEQVEFFALKAGEKHRSEVSKAFRYLRVTGGEDYVLTVEEEYDPVEPILCLQSENKLLDQIMEISKYTFSMCTKEFYLDGAKRDRWLWGGDAYQAYRAEYYYCYDLERIKRTTIALLGKIPVESYINTIIDYTLYIVMSAWETYEHSGDLAFLQELAPMLKAHVGYVLSRLNGDGFQYKQKGDWVFVDWGLQETDGEQSFEQILIWAMLQKYAKILRALGDETTAAAHEARAAKLKAKTDEVFWDEARGAYRFARKNGVVEDKITAHASVIAVLYGFVDEQKRERIKNALLHDESIPPLITPYFECFKLSCLFELGCEEQAAKELETFWGGMVKAGATTFWETYFEGETMEEATAMYGRPFGRSQCHIWGAGPLYIVPRYYFGIENGLNGGDNYLVKPCLKLIQNAEITVPLKNGTLTVAYKDGTLTVYADQTDGKVEVNGKTYTVKKGVNFNEKV